MSRDAAVKVDLTKAPPPSQPAAQPSSATPLMVAYTYDTTIEAPGRAIAGLLGADQEACARAGASVCQLLDSQLDEAGEGTSATLNLRATPQWLAHFRGGLDAQARGAGGRVAGTSTSAEDLTQSIVDSGARVRAETTLRDRLQALLATRQPKLGELLDIEKELARVQGELDAATSELAVLNGRVQMSKLTIHYGEPFAQRRGSGLAVRQAVGDFGAVLGASLAVMINAIAAILPWAVLVGLIVAVGLAARARPRGPSRKP